MRGPFHPIMRKLAEEANGSVARRAVLDHVAIAALELSDGWDLFGALLGGSWIYGGDSPGFWWGQLGFASGPKIELLTPTGGADAAFLERFLATRGASPHHLNFIVPDIAETLRRVQAVGVEPVQVSLANPAWKEAFLHPKDAHGIVIQVAEQSGSPPRLAAPAELPPPGPPTAFARVEHYVADIDQALRLYAEALDGEVVRQPTAGEGSIAELVWDNGAALSLIETGTRSVSGLGQLTFARDGERFSTSDRGLAMDLARRLSVSLQLRD
jgi:methylmalonyl-CoA/ethylmalonyl-CoA epimerase